MDLSVDDIGEYLRESGIDDDVAATFEQNRISGAAFIQLTRRRPERVSTRPRRASTGSATFKGSCTGTI